MTEDKPKIKLTIDRTRWARGGKNGQAALLNTGGTMCCLGFACRALGLEEAEIREEGDPDEVANRLKGDRAALLQPLCYQADVLDDDGDETRAFEWRDKAGVITAMAVNDDDNLADDDREAKLTPVLASLGFDVEFVGDPNLFTALEVE